MNKFIKFSLITITFCIIFIAGFLFAKANLNDSKKQANTVSVERIHNLTDSDKKILQDHVYGQWKITQRLVKVDESEQDVYYNKKFNFSDQGVDVIKEIVLSYGSDYDNYITTEVHPGQTSFTNISDLYLFGDLGGFSLLSHPIYHISYKDSNDIKIYNNYTPVIGTKVPFNIFKSKNVYEINANTGVDPNTDPVVRTSTFGDTLFADPDDTNTLYLDFCGLWEMIRDTTNYRTNGKTDGKG